MPGVVGIIGNKNNFSSCAFSEKPYKSNFILNDVNNGDCSSMVERAVVVRKTSVRFTPFTLSYYRHCP